MNEKKRLIISLRIFKVLNSLTRETKMFIVDKDFNELAVIKQLWPKSKKKKNLCLFHILKTLRQEIHKQTGESLGKQQLSNLCSQIVFAQTEEEYNTKYDILQSSDSFPEFKTYFAKNWHSIRGMWATYERKKFVNFGRRTTNVLESYHKKLKRRCNSNMTVSQFIRELLKINTMKEDRFEQEGFCQQMTVCYVHGHSDLIAEKLQSWATPYAADAVIKKITVGMKVNYDVVQVDSGHYTLTGKSSHYSVTVKDALINCTCQFYSNMKLPCIHIFKCPDTADKFELEWIPKRWQKAIQVCHTITSNSPQTGLLVNKIQNRKPLTRTEKSKEMNRLLKQIANHSVDLAHKNIVSRYEVICTIATAYTEGREVCVEVYDGQLNRGFPEDADAIEL